MSGFRASREMGAVFAAKAVRTFCYGYLGILLPVHLTELGLSAAGVGSFVTTTLVASATLTWAVRAPAERFGPRVALVGLAVLCGLGAALILLARDPWLVILGAMLGNVAVGAGETGPFLSIEQVVLARVVEPARRTTVLSVYNLLGYAAAALGAAAVVVGTPRALFAVFLGGAVVQVVAYALLGGAAPASRRAGPAPPTTPMVRRVAALFALDSFAGGFVVQSLIAYFLHVRFGLGLEVLGWIFFVAQLVTAASLLLAPSLARRFGLLPTMVGTHLLSNVFLIAIAAAPAAWLAVALLYARQLLSQIDVPTRQAWLMTIVPDTDRESAATTTTLWRTAAQSVTPTLTGWIMQSVSLSIPFVLGGALKIVYDIALYKMCRDLTPHEVTPEQPKDHQPA
jgi:MFS family permease